MKSLIELDQPFPSLGARVIYAYLASFPEYAPDPEMDTDDANLMLHDFLYDVALKCFKNPDRIGITYEDDRCFEERWQLNNSNQELMDAMMKIEKNFFDWISFLHKLGLLGDAYEDRFFVPNSKIRLVGKTLEKLSYFGLESQVSAGGVTLRCTAYPKMFPAYKKRCMIPPEKDGQIAYLTRFLFGIVKQPIRAASMFGKLYDDPSGLTSLEEFFELLGYTLKNDERHLQVRWEKEYPDKEKGYLHISYRYRDRRQMCYEFRVPGFRRLLLEHYGEMNYELGELCFTRTKTCDNCGYCTQTDKSGKRQKLALPLTYPNGIMLKCPLWPWLYWNEPDDKNMAKIKKLFLFAQEKLYEGKS